MVRLLKLDTKCDMMGAHEAKQLMLCSAMIMEGPPTSRSKLLPFQEKSRTIDESAWKAGEDILSPLPNDLTRLIYLASIRDYNSGAYRHHVLSHKFEATVAHRVFQMCHEEIFARLLANPISKYVEQLEGYIRYSRAERGAFITTWKSLQAYRAAIPLQVPRRTSETFFLNINTALTILELPREHMS
jgi:hypothetical protein